MRARKTRSAWIEIILGSILLIATFLRLWQLGSVQPGLANDEAGIIYSAYSIWKTGREPAGKFLPTSIQLDNSFSPVYIYITAPFVGLLGLSPWAGRLPFALTGIMSVLLLYFIVKKLSDNDIVALGAAGILALIPWHIYVSRAAFDANFALVFFLAGIYAFLTSQNKRVRSILWSLLWFFLAFYSYHATKLYFVLLLPTLILIYWKSRTTIQRIVFILGTILILCSYVIVLKTNGPNTRADVLIWQNMDQYSTEVNWQREKSTLPEGLRPVFSNKVTVAVRKATETYLEAFSTNYLFLYGETGALTSVYGGIINQGQLFIFMLPFLIFGVVGLSKTSTRTKLLVTLLFLFAPVPSAAASDRTLIFRSFMLLIPLPILAGYGINECIMWLNTQRSITKWIVVAGYSIFIIITLCSYIAHLWYRYPVYGAERWFKSSTDLSIYVRDHHTDYSRVIIVQSGSMFLFQFGIYAKIDPIIIQRAWNARPRSVIDNIVFAESPSCPRITLPTRETASLTNLLLVWPDNCANSLLSTLPQVYTIRERGEPLRSIWRMYSLPANTTFQTNYPMDFFSLPTNQ